MSRIRIRLSNELDWGSGWREITAATARETIAALVADARAEGMRGRLTLQLRHPLEREDVGLVVFGGTGSVEFNAGPGRGHRLGGVDPRGRWGLTQTTLDAARTEPVSDHDVTRIWARVAWSFDEHSRRIVMTENLIDGVSEARAARFDGQDWQS